MANKVLGAHHQHAGRNLQDRRHAAGDRARARGAHALLDGAAASRSMEVGLFPHLAIKGTHASPDGLVLAGARPRRKACSRSNARMPATHLDTLLDRDDQRTIIVVQMQWQMACHRAPLVRLRFVQSRLPARTCSSGSSASIADAAAHRASWSARSSDFRSESLAARSADALAPLRNNGGVREAGQRMARRRLARPSHGSARPGQASARLKNEPGACKAPGSHQRREQMPKQKQVLTEAERKDNVISLRALIEGKSTFKRFDVWIVGDTPLITHSWSEKAKMDMLRKQVKAVQAAGRQARDPEEDFQNSLYEIRDGVYAFPTTAAKLALMSAAHIDKGISKTSILSNVWLDCSMYKVRPALADAVCDMPLTRIYGAKPEKREDMVRVGAGLNKTSTLAYRRPVLPVGGADHRPLQPNASARRKSRLPVRRGRARVRSVRLAQREAGRVWLVPPRERRGGGGLDEVRQGRRPDACS